MSSAPIKLTVLGSGTSMGVPSLGCHCRVCTSSDPHDNRLRPSLLLSRNGQNVVIDTTPDFRQQALKAGMDRLDAILLTHGHADHILGFDDIRPFNLRQQTALPVYGTAETFDVLRRAFSYVFDGKPTLSSIPSVTLHVVDGPFTLLGIPFVPIPLLHGPLQILGYRFGRAAYLTDFSSVPESSLPLLQGLDELIVDALRDVPHPMHQTVEQALALIERLQPRRAWFTHIAHDLPHAETTQRLRKLGLTHVHLAYDGLQLDVSVDAPPQTQHSSPASQNLNRSSTSLEGRSFLVPSPSEGSSGIKLSSPGALVHPEVRRAPEKILAFPSAETWAAHYGPTQCGSVLAIGNFDGIHLGHQAILRAAAQRAAETGAVATALTFDPAPLKVLRPESAPLRLSTNAQRMDWFRAEAIEAAVVLPFTLDLARLSPQDFVDDILVRNLAVRAVLVGENFRFGHRQAGDVKLLRELGMRRGFDVIIIPSVVYKGEVVSSTAIRRLIAAGDVRRAGRLLGRAFALTGEIVSGTGTGHRLTVPTLNLAAEQELLPANGVYVTRTVLADAPGDPLRETSSETMAGDSIHATSGKIGGGSGEKTVGKIQLHRPITTVGTSSGTSGEIQIFDSVTNIGVRPTFNGSSLTVETYLLNPPADFATRPITATRMELRFCKRLRPEQKFPSPEDLRAQITRDVSRAHRFFSLLRNKRGSEL